jgi:hypothetical protein
MRTLLRRRTSTARDERGAVMVLVAVTLPVILLFVAFGVEIGHWYDYSRNLQNRADAAALAAAVQYGGTCFGTATTGQTDVIGKVAQQYAGPPTGTPATNLPFSSINGTYRNQPNLTKGTPANFHMLLNSTRYWDPDPVKSGSNWSMGTAGHNDSTALCNSRDEDGNVGAMVDVRLTQANLGLFFPLFGFTPTISAHARAALQGEASTNAAPIAVGDSGFTPCVSVRLVNAATNLVIQTVTLSKKPPDPQNPTAPAVWDNSGAPASFTMPSSANVYAQPFLSDCNGTGQTYDDSTNTGLLMINNHPSTDPAVPAGSAPQLNTAGVTAKFSGTSCTGSGTQYFSVGGCSITVTAGVTFASGIPNGQRNVYLLERTWDNVNNVWVTPAPSNQNKMSSGGQCTANAFCGTTTIADSSGIDQFVIAWAQTSGTINGTSCSPNPTPAACQGDFGIQAQSFGACNGCNQPDDSGPVVFARVSEVNGASPCQVRCDDTNSFAGGSTHNLVLTVNLSGLNTAAPGSPATVLRFSTSTNHQTGLINCGQGNSGSNDSDVVYYGCGPGNPLFSPPLNPLFVYSRPPGSDCSPATDGNTTGWPNGNQQDCVETTPGQRRQNIICPLVERIVGAPYPGNCQGGAQGTCPVNHWTTQDIGAGDPRAITMIITSPADFAAAGNAPQFWLPIRKFATFYVTGWDKNINPSCTGNGPSQNESFPLKGKQNSDNGAVWGHWINYEDTAGTPNGQLCVVGVSPTNCVPALTR